MYKILILISFVLSVLGCSNKKPIAEETMQAKIDSMKAETAKLDTTLSLDNTAIDSNILKKEFKADISSTLKGMKDSLTEVIVKKAEKSKVTGDKKKKGKTVKSTKDELDGMEIKFSGVVKKDASNHNVYVFATFEKAFEGKIKLKAMDKKSKSLEKVGGKYVSKNVTKLDHASTFVNQAALSHTILTFTFDEAPKMKDIDYFEFSIYK